MLHFEVNLKVMGLDFSYLDVPIYFLYESLLDKPYEIAQFGKENLLTNPFSQFYYYNNERFCVYSGEESTSCKS